MKSMFNLEFKVGAFVVVSISLLLIALSLLGGANSLFTRQNTYFSRIPSVEGLIVGAKVVIGGIKVGIVEDVDFDQELKNFSSPGILVKLLIDKKYEKWIRIDSRTELLTQGMLGDKFIGITSGSQDSPQLANKSEIEYKQGRDLDQFISQGDRLMVSLNSIAGSLDHLLKSLETGNKSEIIFQGMANTAKNLASSTEKLNRELDSLKLKELSFTVNQVLGKINNGTGTLGALINDPSLYYDMKALVGGANRNKIVRNLVRKTIKDGETEQQQEEEPKK